MWFATSDGLNKYDGYRFTVYQHDLNDTTSIGSNDLTCVFEDSKERLWVGTRHNGIELFDRENGVFTHIYHTDENSLRSDNITGITEDKTGVFWIATEQGIDRLEIVTERILTGNANSRNGYSTYKFLFTSIKPDSVFGATKENFERANVLVDSRNRIFITTNNRIWEVKSNGKRGLYSLLERHRFLVEDSSFIPYLLEDTANRCLFLKTMEIVKFPDYNFNTPQKIYGDAMTLSNLTLDRHGRLWIPGIDKTVRMDVRSGQMENTAPEEPTLIRALKVSKVLYTDRTGVVWIGTGGYGILKYASEKERFHHILPQQYLYQLLHSGNGKIITNTLYAATVKKGQPVSVHRFLDPDILKKKFRMSE